MKFKKLIILLFVPMLAFSQNDKPIKQHKLGVGLGYNFNSVMGDSIRPFEVSLRYKLNDKHTFQLYVPFLKHSSSFRSEWPSFHFVLTTTEIKKKVIGVGVSYDYTPISLSVFDLFIGVRAEYATYNHETYIYNSNMWLDNRAYDWTNYSKKNNYFAISPNVGIGIKWQNVYFDARVMLSGYFFDKHIQPTISTKVEYPEETYISTKDWDGLWESGFKTNCSVVVSASYYF